MEDIGKTEKWYESLTVKLILLGGMTIIFLIPLELIRIMIAERGASSDDAKQEISEQWGREQTITGPILNIPVYRTTSVVKEEERIERTVWHILPEQLGFEGRLNPEIRYKGIYEAVIYDSDIKISGSFRVPGESPDDYTVLWNEASVTLGISDNRGLRDSLFMSINGVSTEAIPGVSDKQVFDSGITFPVERAAENQVIGFDLNLGLRGSGGVYFAPAGKTTRVSLSSGWSAPSFSGAFLPTSREISGEGFTAEWLVTHLNRNYPQQWTGTFSSINDSSFGVDLLLEVDHYTKSERSAKYGILFVAFTFMTLLFMELTSSRKIHIFNYFLVGVALVLFFSLLTSLSEHTGFNIAYLVSSVSTITLITLFTGSITGKGKSLLIVGSILSLLYTFIFILLALREFSYLAGNIGLFIALAAIMWFASKTEYLAKSSV